MKDREFFWGPVSNPDGSTIFMLWAPTQARVSVAIDSRQVPMDRADDGWFSITDTLTDDADYWFVLADGTRVPNPASRWQRAGVLGPSRFWGSDFHWEVPWKGRPWEEAIIYEIHIGTFTAEGTFAAAEKHLHRLAELGVSAVQIMPLAQFPGTRGWGYDGVYPYAPHNSYGSPDDVKSFVDEAHRYGLMVFLDVVYNHFGPEGNFLPLYAAEFFRKDDPTPWGPKIAFEREPVRRFFIDNVIYWLDQFRFDGLRFDAVDQIEDQSDPHILKEISEKVRARFLDRHVHLITENPANAINLLSRDSGPFFVADWNDDFHHAMHVAVTGEASGHYAPFGNKPWQKMKQTLQNGYLCDGNNFQSRDQAHSASLPPTAFVHFLQNHDQVGNRALGNRLHTMIDQSCHRVLTEILMLSPQIPLLFMGDDHLTMRKFLFFADYKGELARAIAAGRSTEAENFGGLPDGCGAKDLPDPNDLSTFLDSKLDWDADDQGSAWTSFLKRLIKVRRNHVIPLLPDADGYAGSVVSGVEQAVFLDWKLGARTLQLRANASGRALSMEGDFGHRVYPPVSEAAEEVLQPWTTHLYVL